MKRQLLVLFLVLLSSVGFGTMTNAQSVRSDAEIEAILQQRIDQEQQSTGYARQPYQI